MTFLINAELGEQHFSNTISKLINVTKCMPGAKGAHIAIRKLRLEKLIDSVTDQDNVNREGLIEFFLKIKAAVEAHYRLLDDQD